MAYADFNQRRSLNPLSLGATLVINGCVFAALLFIAPNITTGIGEPRGPIVVRNIPPPKPPPPTPDPDKLVSAQSDGLNPPPPTPTPDHTRSDIVEAQPFPLHGGDEIVLPPPLPPPPEQETVIDPPLPPPPVWIAAIVHPSYANALQPPYPPGRQRAEEEGSATVRVTIGPNGRVIAAEVVRATHTDFADATINQALRKWRFKPATRDGIAVESVREMTVRFIMPRD